MLSNKESERIADFVALKNAKDEHFGVLDLLIKELIALRTSGSQIPLEEKPVDDPESYFNRNKRYAIQLQCVVSPDKRIMNMFAKFPGSVHDARVFASSNIGQSTQNYLTEGEWICGDSAYRNTNYLIVPFRYYELENVNSL